MFYNWLIEIPRGSLREGFVVAFSSLSLLVRALLLSHLVTRAISGSYYTLPKVLGGGVIGKNLSSFWVGR